MALRFRCEHCGKKLQVEQEAGASVMCPFCKNVVVVPADAQKMSAGGGGGAQTDKPEQQEGEEPVEEGKSDAVFAFLATYLPSWGTSVVIHLALILLALTTYTARVPTVKVEYQAEAVVDKSPKKFLKEEVRQAEKSRTTRKALTNSMSSFVFKTSDNLNPDVAANNLKTVEVIGVGGGGQSLGGMPGFGSGRGGGAGEKTDFFGTVGVAKKVVFVVDHSGSMTDSIIYVKYELKRSIKALKPNQQFFVVFYSGPPLEMAARKLVPATEPNKQAAYEFIDGIVPIGQTDPSEALKQAFEQQPELVYILTDGEFEPNIANLIQKLNAKKEITVNTICFWYSSGESLLQKIAQQNNGVYKFVGEEDLQTLGTEGK